MDIMDKYGWLRIEDLQNEPVDAVEERAYAVELYAALGIANEMCAQLEQRVAGATREIERYKLMSVEGGTTYNILDAIDDTLAQQDRAQ